MTSTGSAAPGWYPDPHNPAQLRYWDGAAWTESVSPAQAGHPQGTYQQAGHPHAGMVQGGGAVGQPPFAVSSEQSGSGLGELGSWLSATFTSLISRIGPIVILLFAVPTVGWTILLVLARSQLSGVSYNRGTDELVGFEPTSLIVLGVAFFAFIPVLIVAWLGANHQMYGSHAKQPQTLARSLSTGLRRLPRTIGWGIVFSLATMAIIAIVVGPLVAGAILIGPEVLLVLLLIVPLSIVASVWIGVKLAFFGTALAVAPSGHNPFRASWAISRGRWWAVFGRLLVLWAIIYGVSFIGQFATQIGATLVPSQLGFDVDSETGELLIDGQAVADLEVIEFDTFIPNLVVLVVFLAFYLLTQAISQALSVSGSAGLYYRGGAAAEL